MSTKYLFESVPARHMDATTAERERVMSGGRASREKNSRTERAIVCLLQERGLATERVSSSVLLRGEAKCPGDGFDGPYEWLEGRNFLVLRADRRPLLVVVKLELAAEIAALAECIEKDATVKIISPEQRRAEPRGARIVVTGPFAVGKTSLVRTLDPGDRVPDHQEPVQEFPAMCAGAS